MAVAGQSVWFFARPGGGVRIVAGEKKRLVDAPLPGETELSVVAADVHIRVDAAVTADIVVYPEVLELACEAKVTVACPACGHEGSVDEWCLDPKGDGVKESDDEEQEGTR